MDMNINMQSRHMLFLQVGLILQAGYGLEQGLHLIAEQLDEQELKTLVCRLNEEREKQPTLADAFAACEVFDDFTIHMISIGEISGNLDEVMLSLADYYQRMDEMSNQLRQALSYPMILLLMMLCVVGVVAWKVLPLFQDVLRSLGSDLSTQAVMFMQFGRIFSMAVFGLLLLLTAGLIVFLLYAKRQKEDAATLFLFHNPFFKKLRHISLLAQLTYALAMLLRSGIDLREAMQYACSLLPNCEIIDKLQACVQGMNEGESFCDVIRKEQLYEGLALNLIEIGFTSGKGEAVMQQLSDEYQQEVSHKTEHYLNVIEPIIVLLLAVIIGVVLLSIMLPLVSILSSL